VLILQSLIYMTTWSLNHDHAKMNYWNSATWHLKMVWNPQYGFHGNNLEKGLSLLLLSGNSYRYKIGTTVPGMTCKWSENKFLISKIQYDFQGEHYL